jgi:hypothetical protein
VFETMPSPEPKESRDEFIDRCTTQLLEDGEENDPDVAESICGDLWDQAQKTAKPILHKVKPDAAQANGREFILIDESVDRMGDVILSSSWDLSSFNRNPVALFSHNSEFPIGRWRNVHVNKGSFCRRDPRQSCRVDAANEVTWHFGKYPRTSLC